MSDLYTRCQKPMKTTTLHLALVASLVAMSAQAVPTAFFGEDTPSRGSFLSEWPNATAAASAFNARFGDQIVIETLESVASTFPYRGSVTLGEGVVMHSGAHSWDPGSPYTSFVETGSRLSGDMWIGTGSGFALDFDQPVDGFGMFGYDVGDREGQMFVDYLTLSGVTGTLAVPHSFHGFEENSDSIIFFGADSADDPFVQVTVRNTAANHEHYWIDDLVISRRVPDSGGTIILMLLSAGSLIGVRRVLRLADQT